MEGQALRGSYPLTDIWLRAHEWGDESARLRVSVIAQCIALDWMTQAMRLLAQFAAREYR